jgi:polar amino acid transport system substrate-binding protein
MKKFLTLAAMVCLASTFTFASGSTETSSVATPTEEKVYKVAIDAAYPPFSIQLDSGETREGTVVSSSNGMGDYYGIDVELLDAIAQEEGFSYDLMPMDFSAIIPALVSGTIDASIAGMNATEERKEVVDFSTGYYEAGSAMVVNAEDDSIKTFADLKGKTAASKEGTTGMLWSQDNADKYGFSVNVYPDSASMMLAVSNGQADFLLEDYPVISYQIKIGAQKDLKVAIEAVADPPQDAFAVAKGKNQDLLKMFNDGLEAIKANGTYDTIINQFK